MSTAIYVLESLGPDALRSEPVVQLLLFACKHKKECDLRSKSKPQGVILLAVDGDVSGRDLIRKGIPELAVDEVVFEELATPEVPGISYLEHRLVYAVFEALKDRRDDEIHFADRGGLGYYLTMAKRCGTQFVETTLVSHVMGGTLFCLGAEEALVDSEIALTLDVFECSSTEFSDVVFVHDRLAWAWYEKRLASVPTQRFDVGIGERSSEPGNVAASVRKTVETARTPVRLVFYGPLGAEAGLRGFCDAVSLLILMHPFPVEVIFLGPPKPVGAIDAVTYIRLRSQSWGVPLTIKRNLTLLEEFDFIAGTESIVFCDATRKEGLRSRLLDIAGIPCVLLTERTHGLEKRTPVSVVAEILDVKARLVGTAPHRDIVAAWSHRRSWSLSSARVSPLVSPTIAPMVSVVVTHFSRPQKLRFALESLKAQTYGNFEVIVVDDGSPDADVVRELLDMEKQIKPLGWTLIRQENRYLGAARNRGAKQAAGKYVLFMDDDNYARPSEVETLVAVAERVQADIVTPFYDCFETDDEIAEDEPKVRLTPVGGDLALSVFNPAMGDANALYSLEIFHKIGGFTEDYGITHEDWEFHVRADLAGAKRVTVPVPLFWYRVDPRGMYRNPQMRMHANANLLRHIRPYLETLPHYQGKLVQIAQGLAVQRDRLQTAKPANSYASQQSPGNLPFARVAIIVRTKDRPVMLQRAIRDILAQSYQDWVVVVVNDGGDVPVLELVLDQYKARLGYRLVRVDNPVSYGMQTASNIGIGTCDSDFIVIHDDDDSWDSEFLTRTVADMDQDGWNPRVAGVVTWSQVIVEEIVDDYHIIETDRFMFNDQLYTLSLVDLGIENRFPPISFLFRRTAFEDVGRFREEFGVLGDWDFHLRVLERFDIRVIPEPLAGYHHRSESTGGAYGNSVHAQKDVHTAKRIQLVNSFIRGSDGQAASTIGQLLLHGQIYKNLERDQRASFQRLHDQVWEVEQSLKYYISELGMKSRFRLGKRPSLGDWPSLGRLVRPRWWRSQPKHSENLVENGDFRNWPGPGELYNMHNLSTGIVSPGCVISFDGDNTTYTLERNLSDGSQSLDVGKPYLSVVNKGQSGAGKYMWLEFPISNVAAIVGQALCISGVARLRGTHEWISVGGRIDVLDRRSLLFQEQRVFLTDDFRPWSCTLACPSSGPIDFSSSLGRIHIKLHYTEPFTFELTDVQVEVGDTATKF